MAPQEAVGLQNRLRGAEPPGFERM